MYAWKGVLCGIPRWFRRDRGCQAQPHSLCCCTTLIEVPCALKLNVNMIGSQHVKMPPLFAGNCSQRCAQVLLTLDNLANRGQYINARNTFTELLTYGAILVVNENVSNWVGNSFCFLMG